jgi:hypothetical protein
MNDLQTIWQSQPMEEQDMITLSDLRARAEKFQRSMHWRNALLYAYSILSLASTIVLARTGRFNAMLGPGLLLAVAHLFVIWQLWWRARARDLPGELGGHAALDFLRQELQRQRDIMARAWAWYIAPFMPGLAWELLVRAQTPPRAIAYFWFPLSAALFWIAVWLAFSRGAARLDIQLERLRSLKAE